MILWHIPISHYNEKARWALDFKRIPHQRRTPLPTLHRLTALRLTRGKHDRLPLIQLRGRRVGDSTAIIAALEDQWPDPPLYPSGSTERDRALELEDYFDEELAPRVRRFFWYHTLPDTEATIGAVAPGAGPARVRLMRTVYPLASRVTVRDYDVNESNAEEALNGMRAAMDRLERELDGGDYLVGSSFTVADLAAAALFTPILGPEGRPCAPHRLTEPVREARDELSARPGGQWVSEMYHRHRGVSAETR